MPKNQQIENDLEAYVTEQESQEQASMVTSDTMIGSGIKSDAVSNPNAFDRYKSKTIDESKEAYKEDFTQTQKNLGMGFLSLPIDSLPSEGMFYPEGTKLMIRAANGAEIRHWSTVEETQPLEVVDHLNYILERCLKVNMPGKPNSSWKDLKEIDRFYVILAIRDFTFTDGQNELSIEINENKSIPLKKDNIDFVHWDEKLLKYYNQTDKCFTFPTKSKIGQINIYMPCVGVSNWLQTYAQKKNRAKQGYDEDFLQIAPLLLKDYRGLNDNSYQQFISSCYEFTPYDWSLIAKVKDLMVKSIEAKFIYQDEDGAEQSSPLNFQGGIKSIFLYDIGDIL